MVKNLSACAGDMSLIPWLERYLGIGNGNPFRYSCLENSTDKGTWLAPVHGVIKSRAQLNEWTHTHNKH